MGPVSSRIERRTQEPIAVPIGFEKEVQRLRAVAEAGRQKYQQREDRFAKFTPVVIDYKVQPSSPKRLGPKTTPLERRQNLGAAQRGAHPVSPPSPSSPPSPLR